MDATSPSSSPHRASAGTWAIIALGGATGTALRAALESANPAQPEQWPWTTFAINLCGSFVLGLLLHVLALSGSDAGRRRALRLMLGTGVLGGFTTYSTFTVEIDQRLGSGHLPLALGYAVTSVVAGITLAGLGMAVADRLSKVGRDA